MAFSDRVDGSWPDDCMEVDAGRLARLRPFPQDKNIEFFEKDHYYNVFGERYPISTTGFISGPLDPFLTFEVINGMSDAGRAKWGGGDDKSICIAWKKNGARASRLGTKLHAAIEIYLNTGVISTDPEIQSDMEQFLRFEKEILKKRNIKCWRTEPIIYTDPETGVKIAGSVDFIGFDGVNYWIMDWKRPKDLVKTTKPGKRKKAMCHPPFQMYAQTDYVKYSIQLHTYRYIFQRFYGLTIPKENLFIVGFHPNIDGYHFFDAIDVESQVNDMIENYDYWLERYRQKNAMVDADFDKFGWGPGEFDEMMAN